MQKDYLTTTYIPYRLQFFAKEGLGGERTEEATAKKLNDARKEGKVAKSQELIMASGLLAFFALLKFTIGTIGGNLMDAFKENYAMIGTYAKEEFSIAFASSLLSRIGSTVAITLIPIAAIGILVALLVNVLQVKWMPSAKPIQPKFNKINPLTGFKKLFSKEKLFELVKSIAKVAIIGYLTYDTLVQQADMINILYEIGSLSAAIALIGEVVLDLGMKISMFFIVIGIADYLFQKYRFRVDMRMSKEEIKEEFKQTEGDPKIKGRIRQKMREASMRRMMQMLPKADVVITNPTHYACALRYDKETSEAPVLIAKGADYLAEKIKKAARENHIPLYENKPLARMLYYNVELDQEIPRELYQMTAEVLAYVYSLKNQAG